MNWLLDKGIESLFHFIPLHSSVAGKHYGTVRSKIDITDWAGNCLLRLPLMPQMTNEEVGYTIHCLKTFFERH